MCIPPEIYPIWIELHSLLVFWRLGAGLSIGIEIELVRIQGSSIRLCGTLSFVCCVTLTSSSQHRLFPQQFVFRFDFFLGYSIQFNESFSSFPKTKTIPLSAHTHKGIPLKRTRMLNRKADTKYVHTQARLRTRQRKAPNVENLNPCVSGAHCLILVFSS